MAQTGFHSANSVTVTTEDENSSSSNSAASHFSEATNVANIEMLTTIFKLRIQISLYHKQKKTNSTNILHIMPWLHTPHTHNKKHM